MLHSMTETGYDTLYVKWGSIIMFQNFKKKATNGTQNILSLKSMKMNLQKFVVNYGDEVNEEDTFGTIKRYNNDEMILTFDRIIFEQFSSTSLMQG